MKKQPEITAKTKCALATSFCDLYSQTSIDKITIKEITTLAGYNRSTFYQYFTDVYDLLEYIENDLLVAMKTSWENEDNTLLSPNINHLITLFESKEHYLKAVLGDYGSIHFLERLKKELSLNTLTKSYNKAENLIPYLIEFHISTSLSLFRVWIKNGKDLPIDNLLELVHDLCTKGVSHFINKI